MKISCEIIKDLLPLYQDEVCSKDSRIVVEEHISHCENCKAELQAMKNILPVNIIEENLNEAENVKNISKEWNRKMLRSLLEGFLIAAVIALIIFCFVGIKSTS